MKTPLPRGDGYCHARIDGSLHRVHILEGELFLPPALPGQTQVNHKDGDKSNNHISNLEWITPAANTQHSYDNLPRESNVPRRSKRVRCRKEASDDPSAWLYYDSCSEAARQLRLDSGGGEQSVHREREIKGVGRSACPAGRIIESGAASFPRQGPC